MIIKYLYDLDLKTDNTFEENLLIQNFSLIISHTDLVLSLVHQIKTNKNIPLN